MGCALMRLKSGTMATGSRCNPALQARMISHGARFPSPFDDPAHPTIAADRAHEN
jgi:hypothetical protein